MTKFSPAMLVPASKVEAFSKPGGGPRTVTATALDNIAKLKEALAKGEQVKKSLRYVGEQVGFQVRVGNTALVLAPEKDDAGKSRRDLDGKFIGEREMAVAKEHGAAALDYVAERIQAGDYREQLEELTVGKEARSATRAANKAAKTKPAEENTVS